MAVTNNVVVKQYPPVDAFGVDITVTNPVAATFDPQQTTIPPLGAIFGGDMVYLTAANKVASLSTAGATNANAASFLGVSVDQYPLQLGAGVYQGFADGIPRVQVQRAGYFAFYTTAADVYAAGQVVYLGANGQTVQKTAAGVAIGKVAGDQRQVGVALGNTITGGAGVRVVIQITPAL